MTRVFVSHAGADLALAREVHRWLIEAGHEAFLAQDLGDGIPVGEEWEQRLHDELRLADAVVCIVTSAYLASRWCAAEVAIARSRGSKLLPVKAESGVTDTLLRSVQHADLTHDPDAVRRFLAEELRQVDAVWPDDCSPFPGLRPFESGQHRVFFGRTDETKELAELLRSPAEHSKGAALLVVGPSGCGKSSLVRAGLVPVMADEPGWWTLPPIAPGADPVAALVRELAAAARQLGLDPTVTQIHQQLDAGHLMDLVDELLLAAPGGPRRRLLVVVDQLEELLTQTAPADRARFAELLGPMLSGSVALVAALRPEFLDQLLTDADLATVPTQVYPLRPLRREALRGVIENPARLAGINVDDSLVDRLVDDTDSGEALPLLAFTLAQLTDGVTRGGHLSSARYDQLGGVQGALTRRADAALADAVAAGGRSSEQVITELLRLVTVDEQGRPTRWRGNRDELPDQVVTELSSFVTRRLLTTDTDNGTVVIGVAHEAFLSTWPPLAGAIAANVAALRARRAVEHAATEWHGHARPRARLWSGGQLAAAVADTGAHIRPDCTPQGRPRWPFRQPRVLVTEQVDLSPTARDFLHTSIRHDRRRRRRAVTILSVLLISALVGAGVAVIQQRDAREQQRIATTRELIAQADAIQDTDPRTALLLGAAAERIHPSGETRASLVNTLTTTRYAGTLAGQTAPVTSVAFSPDGRTLATGDSDGTVILQDLSGPARSRQPLAAHPSAVASVAFSPDGHTLATGSFDGTALLWDLSDPARPRQSPAVHTGLVSSMTFSPDARTLATGNFDGTVVLWDLTTAVRRELSLPGHTDAVFSVAFSPDARLLATGDSAGLAVVWDLADPARPRQSLAVHTGTVNSVAFAPDGRTLATASDDGSARLWNLTDPVQAQPLESVLNSHTSAATAVAFAPDGHTLATASDDGSARLWDLTDARPRLLGSKLTSHTSRVTDVAFAPDGHMLATASSDRTVILWDLTDQPRPRPLGQPLTGQPSSVDSVMFAPDGHTLAVTSSDGTVTGWNITDPARPRREQSQARANQLVDSLAVSPDGNTTVSASSDSTLILWDLTDRSQPRRLGQPLVGHTGLVTSAAFAGDGRTLATAGDDGMVIVWDLTDRGQPRRLGQPLAGHTSSMTSVALASGGTILATGGSDATVTLWDLTDLNQLRDHATERACTILGRGLTRDEWDRYIPGLPYQDSCSLVTAETGGSR